MHTNSVPDPQQPQELLRVCRIGKAQGLKGEVSVELYTDDPHARFAPGEVLYAREFAADALHPYTVAAARTFKNRWYVRFEGVDDRNAAEALHNTVLYGEPQELDDDEFYPKDLLGLEVYLEFEVAAANADDAPEGAEFEFTDLGKVVDVIEGAQWLLKIRMPNREAFLLPFVEALVPEVNLEEGYLTVDPPGGLIPGIGTPDTVTSASASPASAASE